MSLPDPKDLSGWVNKFTADLYSWALYKTSKEELAKDLVQDTFLAAAEKFDSFRGDSTPRTFLFSILNNKIIDYYRKKVRLPHTLDNKSLSEYFNDEGDWRDEKKPSEWYREDANLLDNVEFQEVLGDCIGNLPEKWGICIHAKYLENKKTEEICQDLGITASNYWQIMHRAKLKLRDCVEQNWFLP